MKVDRPIHTAVRVSGPRLVERCRRNASRRRPGFTLVELLVVISIITLLASLVLVALAGVQETARADRTRAQIARIDALLTERWETYRTRRIPIPPSVRRTSAPGTRTSGASFMGKLTLDALRVNTVREIMRMELPDRKTDVLMGPAVLARGTVPAVWNAYRRQAGKLLNQRRTDVNFPVNDPQLGSQLDTYWSSDFESAECLYLILTQIIDQETKALSFFSPREIGDIDNDGMPEILDGWGRPIIFLRWAPGLQISGSPQVRGSPDQFDVTGFYPRVTQAPTFALYPLIASSGPDQKMEIFADNPNENNRINYSLTSPPNNPFLGLLNYGGYRNQTTVEVGTPQDSDGDGVFGSIDNITNHNLTGS